MWQIIFEFANNHPAAFTSIVMALLAFFTYIITRFSWEWDGFKPKFKSRKLENQQIEEMKNKLAEYEKQAKFVQQPDFLKQTENGEYIGFIVAKKPYIAVWADGNWNTEEHFQQFDRLTRLWENEDEIVIHGKNPNIPSDLQHTIESKAKSLPSLTIYCSNNDLAKYLTTYYKDFPSVKIINRG
jgi:hypothetical protein